MNDRALPADTSPRSASRYSAFISYNHKDERWAAWLQRSLETYRVPKRLQGQSTSYGTIDARLRPVFRDRDELSTSADLGSAVQEALGQSQYLIVICSPNAVASRWVNEEVRTFARLVGSEHIRCLIVAGKPGAGNGQECFPPALREVGILEPLAADVRKGKDPRSAARLKLIAGILGVSYDELRQREAARQHKRLAVAATASGAGFLIMAALAVSALLARNEAVQQRDLARQRTLTAERTVSFVKSMFEVSDPSEARGAAITAREVLDRGSKLVDRGLDEEPAVKAEIGVTLGEVYGSLGLYKDSDRLIRNTFKLKHAQPRIAVRQFLAYGENLARLGEYDGAIAALRAALRRAEPPASADAQELLPRVLVSLGQADSAIGNDTEAQASIRRALALDLKRFGPNNGDVARDLEALGLSFYYAGELDKAQPYISRALRIRRSVEGELSPSVSDDLNTLASIAYAKGDLETAEPLFRRNLAIDEKVLGRDHPDLAATLNNLGRVLLERRKFAQAESMLARALSINLHQRSETHDDLAFVYSNLALAKQGQGRLDEAEALFLKGLRAAEVNKHRTRGPIMTDLAGLYCRTGRTAQGLDLLKSGRPLEEADYPDDPWRAAWTDNVRGECLLIQGDIKAARQSIESSAPVLAARWPTGTYFRYESDRRTGLLARARREHALRTAPA